MTQTKRYLVLPITLQNHFEILIQKGANYKNGSFAKFKSYNLRQIIVICVHFIHNDCCVETIVQWQCSTFARSSTRVRVIRQLESLFLPF